MSANENQNSLFPLVELLYMPMTFYVLVQFEKIDTLKQGLLWLVVFALVQNEYHSIKQSSPQYTLWLYLSDVMSLFIYLLAIKAIFTTGTIAQTTLGYDPLFWGYLSALWLSYAIWDWIMINHEQIPRKKTEWRRWRNGMLVCFFISVLCGIALFMIINLPMSPPLDYITIILQIMLFGCVGWALLGWWLRDNIFEPIEDEAK